MQERIRSEIKETLAKNNGNLTYDSVLNMEYLGMVLSGKLCDEANKQFYSI